MDCISFYIKDPYLLIHRKLPKTDNAREDPGIVKHKKEKIRN